MSLKATPPEDLRSADTATLVVESGRHLEGLAKQIVTTKSAPDGKPLMLGERMRELKDRLDKPTWQAYRAWSAERNAYVHAERTDLTDRERFYEDYALVAAALGKLRKPRRKSPASKSKPKGKRKDSAKTAPAPVGRYVALAAVIVALIVVYYEAC